jgi:hypothetical protein
LYARLFFAYLLLLLPCLLFAQQPWKVQGTVTDFTNKYPVDAVTVYSKSGYKTITDSTGRYSISVVNGDSIWFSYFNKQTMRYAVDTISNTSSFDVALHIEVLRNLPEVRVRSSDYKQDSIQNRKDYAKIFNFRKPGLRLATSPPQNYTPGSLTVGLDLTELINAFRFRRNKRLASLQERLVNEEQDKFVYHRFTKRLVKQLTGLDSTALTEFMTFYKPDYDVLLRMNEIELGYYIEECHKQYAWLKAQRIPLKRYYVPRPNPESLKLRLP